MLGISKNRWFVILTSYFYPHFFTKNAETGPVLVRCWSASASAASAGSGAARGSGTGGSVKSRWVPGWLEVFVACLLVVFWYKFYMIWFRTCWFHRFVGCFFLTLMMQTLLSWIQNIGALVVGGGSGNRHGFFKYQNDMLRSGSVFFKTDWWFC